MKKYFFFPVQAKFGFKWLMVNAEYCNIVKYSVFMLHILIFLPKVE